MVRTLILMLFVSAAACSDTADSADMSQADGSTAHDSGASTRDVGGTAPDSGDTLEDTGNLEPGDVRLDATTAADAGPSPEPDTGFDSGTVAPDMAVDTGSNPGTDPYAGRPLGQCTMNSDCPSGPGGQDCSEALPGGACLGCGGDQDCPGTAECGFGTCITPCDSEADCAPGLRCLGSGRCAAMPCQNDVCPVEFFGCNASGNCTRIDCSADASVCPAMTTCTGGWCIEDRSL